MATEFTDSYSDDMIFLKTVRRSLLRHPLEYRFPKLLDATLARLHAVMLVGNTENSISQEFERTQDPKLNEYLNRPQLSNMDKVESLRSYLQVRLSEEVDAEVLEDYLAIKYLRNGIIHSDRRRGEQAAHVTSRGFPLDSRELTVDHLRHFAEIDQAMTGYLGMSRALETIGNLGAAFSGLPYLKNSSTNHIASDKAVSAPFSFNDFIQIHKNNLEKINTSWVDLMQETGSKSGPELVRKVKEERADAPASERVRTWGRIADYSWNEIVRLWPDDSAQRLVGDMKYRTEMLQRIRSIAADGTFPVRGRSVSSYSRLWRVVRSQNDLDDSSYRELFGGTTTLTGSELLEIYAVGDEAYNLISKIPLGWLWPLFTSNGIDEVTGKADAFIDIYELARTWYSAVENVQGIRPDDKKTVNYYREGVAAT